MHATPLDKERHSHSVSDCEDNHVVCNGGESLDAGQSQER